MRLLNNRYSGPCPLAMNDDDECCCNCEHMARQIHPILGFVGYVCKLPLVFGEDNVRFIGMGVHGRLCECYSRNIPQKFLLPVVQEKVTTEIVRISHYNIQIY